MEIINLDMTPSTVTPNAHAGQYDSARTVRFMLKNGGVPFTLAGTETITAEITRSDNTEVTVNVANTSSNYVDVVFDDTVCTVKGLYACELRVVDGGVNIGSKNFALLVQRDPYDGAGVVVETVGPADICTFETTLPEPYQSVTVNVLATGGNGTPDSPIPINGYTEANIVNTQNESIVDLFSIDSDFRGTVAFNQLVSNPTQVLSFTANANAEKNIQIGISFVANRVYYASYRQKDTMTRNVRNTLIYNDGSAKSQSTQSNRNLASGYYFWIFKPQNMTTGTLSLWCHTPDVNVDYDNFNLIDLTAMFGSTIADYIYSLEQNNAGAGVAFFRNIYPEDYYAYDSGTTEIVGKETPEATIAFGQTVYGGQLIILPDRTYFHGTHMYLDLGTLNYTYYSGLLRFGYRLDDGKPSGTAYGLDTALCECYPVSAVQYSNMPDDSIMVGSNFFSGSVGSVVIHDESYTSVPAIQTALLGKKLVYELATPFDIDLTPEVISAVVGTNNVFADCGQTTVKYLKVEA